MKSTSFSQTQNFAACNQKWFIASVLKIQTPQSESAILGDHFHKMMENWVVGKEIESYTSKYPTLGRIFKNNKSWFDQMSKIKGLKVEEHIEKKLNFMLDCGINLYMKCDLIEGDNKEILSDYKSMSSFNYALDEEKLKNDQQMNLYAHFINKERKENGNKQLITTLRHYQVNTRDCSIRTVEAPFSREIGALTESKCNAYTLNMLAVEKQKIEFVQKNRASCSDYGGCPYLEFCNKKETEGQLRARLSNKINATDDDSTPEAKLKELKTELGKGKKMGFADRLKGMAKAQDEQQTNFKKTPAKKAAVIEERESPDGEEDEVDEDAIDRVVKKKGKTFSKKVEVDEDEDNLDDDNLKEDDTDEDDVPTPKKKSGSVNTMKSLVFVGCMPTGEEVTKPADYLHDQFVKPLLKKHKIKMLCQAPYNAAAQDLLGYAEEIKNELYSKPFIYIDVNRAVDNKVLEMLLEDDSGRFIIVRKVF